MPEIENYDILCAALRAGIFTHPTAAEGLTFLLAGTPTPGQ